MGVLAPKSGDQIIDLNPSIARLKTLAGDDFSQIPRSEKERLEFAKMAVEVNAKVQQLMQQGYALGTEVTTTDGSPITLAIGDVEQLSTLQARLNDVNQLLPPEKQIDLTNIKVAIQSYASEIINYDKLVELLNVYIDETTPDNRAAVEEHINPLDQKNRDEITEVLDGIEQGRYKEHFDTETLTHVRNTIRTAQQELMIYKWAADHNYNGNDILSAYNLYRPGISLVDNPQLSHYIEAIEEKLDISFFEKADFEEALLAYFSDITNQ